MGDQTVLFQKLVKEIEQEYDDVTINLNNGIITVQISKYIQYSISINNYFHITEMKNIKVKSIHSEIAEKLEDKFDRYYMLIKLDKPITKNYVLESVNFLKNFIA